MQIADKWVSVFFKVSHKNNIQQLVGLFWKEYFKKTFICLFLSKEVFQMYFIQSMSLCHS